jgi:hypothetical protein
MFVRNVGISLRVYTASELKKNRCPHRREDLKSVINFPLVSEKAGKPSLGRIRRVDQLQHMADEALRPDSSFLQPQGGTTSIVRIDNG